MPSRDFTNHSFQQFLNEHRFVASRCQTCNTSYLPPRPLCTHCYGEQMEWFAVPIKGKLIAFTTIHIGSTAMIEAGYGRNKPYCSGIVELDNGLSISAQILGVDATKPEEIKIGTPLTAVFVDRGQGEERKSFLAFEVNGE